MKVLFVASFGGHWVQMRRLAKLVECSALVYVGTAEGEHDGADDYLEDFSIRELWCGMRQLPRALGIVRRHRPDLIISTGAAPGLLLLFAGFLLGMKTVWVDSIANSQRLSLSGRVAKLFASRVLTQWPALAKGRVQYQGSLL
ncbi:oligosaccharide biosynthesis protein Alg14 [Halomonas sp. 1513]|nr:oligosaccharide biosynthesis protein Alg14 [Halomonas sp. 1513]APX92954.1 oligosaccharide biosynthesis protein Alg14 [Halomonas sp. 1513]